MGVRLRQVALVGQDLDWSVRVLTALFDTYVAYRDPDLVPQFGGMFNALLAFDDCFLEVVSPTDKGYEVGSTSARLLQRNGGDCGYMAILQVDDIAATSTSLARLGRAALAYTAVSEGEPGSGLRNVRSSRYELGAAAPKAPGTTGHVLVQWHPKDFGTLVETDEQWPPLPGAAGAWMPAGNRWQQSYHHRKSNVCEGFAGVEVAVRGDPTAMARRWAEGLGCPVVGDAGSEVQLDGSVVRFVPPGSDGREGVVGVDVYAVPGKPKAFTECHIHGIRWRLVDRPGAARTEPLHQTLLRSKL